jgi:site-specific DNA-methyltransferase (adenine-specific)
VRAEIAEVLDGSRTWSVITGDCLKVLAELGERAVDHTISDPPYEAAAHTKQRRLTVTGTKGNAFSANGRKVAEAPLSFEPITEAQRDQVAAEVARVSKRWQIVFCQVEAANLWSRSLVEGGANVRRIGIWVKPDGMPQLTGDRPGMGYETLVFAHRPGRSRWNGGGKTAVFTHNKACAERLHETQKPIALMVELIELFTDPGDLVLDPYCGSGSTGAACLRLGRRFLGIEKSETYAATARERLDAEARGLTVGAARAGQTTLFDVLGAP